MVRSLQVLNIMLVAVALAPLLAHALELPGKMRLDKATYLAVQPIYYPGFTFAGGIGEAGGMLALIVLLFVTPRGSAPFWWTLAALAMLVASHLTYWFVTHPVNNFWLKDTNLSGFGKTFFSLFTPEAGADWSKLRNVWEYSHVARACFATLSLVALALAVTA